MLRYTTIAVCLIAVGCLPTATPSAAVNQDGDKQTEKQPSDQDIKIERALMAGVWTVGGADPNRIPFGIVQSWIIDKNGELVTAYQGREILYPLPLDSGVGKRTTYTIKLDPTKTPKQIDLISKDTDIAGMYAMGVYRINGDKIQMSFNLASLPRPKGVIDGRYVVTLERSGN